MSNCPQGITTGDCDAIAASLTTSIDPYGGTADPVELSTTLPDNLNNKLTECDGNSNCKLVTYDFNSDVTNSGTADLASYLTVQNSTEEKAVLYKLVNGVDVNYLGIPKTILNHPHYELADAQSKIADGMLINTNIDSTKTTTSGTDAINPFNDDNGMSCFDINSCNQTMMMLVDKNISFSTNNIPACENCPLRQFKTFTGTSTTDEKRRTKSYLWYDFAGSFNSCSPVDPVVGTTITTSNTCVSTCKVGSTSTSIYAPLGTLVSFNTACAATCQAIGNIKPPAGQASIVRPLTNAGYDELDKTQNGTSTIVGNKCTILPNACYASNILVSNKLTSSLSFYFSFSNLNMVSTMYNTSTGTATYPGVGTSRSTLVLNLTGLTLTNPVAVNNTIGAFGNSGNLGVVTSTDGTTTATITFPASFTVDGSSITNPIFIMPNRSATTSGTGTYVSMSTNPVRTPAPTPTPTAGTVTITLDSIPSPNVSTDMKVASIYGIPGGPFNVVWVNGNIIDVSVPGTGNFTTTDLAINSRCCQHYTWVSTQFPTKPAAKMSRSYFYDTCTNSCDLTNFNSLRPEDTRVISTVDNVNKICNIGACASPNFSWQDISSSSASTGLCWSHYYDSLGSVKASNYGYNTVALNADRNMYENGSNLLIDDTAFTLEQGLAIYNANRSKNSIYFYNIKDPQICEAIFRIGNNSSHHGFVINHVQGSILTGGQANAACAIGQFHRSGKPNWYTDCGSNDRYGRNGSILFCMRNCRDDEGVCSFFTA